MNGKIRPWLALVVMLAVAFIGGYYANLLAQTVDIVQLQGKVSTLERDSEEIKEKYVTKDSLEPQLESIQRGIVELKQSHKDLANKVDRVIERR